MKHYDYVEWLLYKTRSLPKEKLDKMEDHLYNCNLCMDIFLSLISGKELELAGKIAPEDFASDIIEKISKNKTKEIAVKDDKKAFIYQFMYYVAAASVTILLTMGGFYSNLVDSVPRIKESIQVVEEDKANHIAKFSDRIINSTSNLLLGIENMNQFKEDNNER